jgi:hypothetical protein
MKRPFPHGDERKAINAAFDAFAATLKTEETDTGVKLLRRDDRVLPSGVTLTEAREQIAALRGMPVARAQEIVERLTGGWKGGFTVKVVASTADLPGKQPSDARGLYANGVGYVVAGRHKTAKEIGATLAHEVINHHGLRAMLGREKWTRLMTRIQNATAAGNKDLQALRDEVRRLYVDKDGNYTLTNPLLEADEIAARAIEASVDENGELKPAFAWLKWVWSEIAAFLRDIGIPMKFTTAELHGIFVASRRNLARAGRAFGPSSLTPAMQARGVENRGMDLDRLREALQGYTDGNATERDLLAEVQFLLDDGGAPDSLREITERFAAEVEENETIYAGRGDEYQVADAFVQAVEAAAAARPATDENVQTDTPAFKKWFGDSKVVDAEGRPLVVYKGGPTENWRDGSDITEFRSANGPWAGFFTSSTDAANRFAQAQLPMTVRGGSPAGVFAVYISIKKPLMIDAEGKRARDFQIDASVVGQQDSPIREQMLSGDYDGLILRNTSDEGDVFVPLRPEQIKSAIGNDGNFDPFDPSILHARGGPNIAGNTGRQYTPVQEQAMRNVGFAVDPVPLSDRLRNLWQNAGKLLAQGIVDQFAPIKDISKEAYGLLRLSKGASGAFEVLLRGGQLKLDAGVYDFDAKKRGGVVDRLLTPLQGEHHDFFRWVAANRAEQLSKEDREHLFTPADIAALKTLADGNLDFDFTLKHGPRAGQITRSRAEAYRDSLATFNEFNKNTLDMAEQSGLIDGASRSIWERQFYVPFYRVEQEGGVRGMNVKSGVVRQQAFKALKGGSQQLNADLLENTLMNWAHLLDAAAKNRAAKATLEALSGMGAAIEADEATVRQMAKSTGAREGVVWMMDQGRQRFFLIDDPYLMTAVSALEFAGMNSPMMKALGSFKNVLTIGVTASPFFKIRNLIRDSLQVVGTSPISGNIAGNLAQGWRATARDSEEYYRLLAGGGTIHFGTMLEGSEAKRVQALVEAGVDRATILDTGDRVKAFYRKVIEPTIGAYNELGNRGEAVNRAALYQQLRAAGVDHAQASLQARDLMDFSMQGSFTTVRFLTQVVPFLNARLQGLYKLGRGAAEDPARFSAVLGATALVSLGLLAAYSDDDDWKKREDWDRNNFWWFKAGGIAYRIPKPFEIGAIATLAERSFEAAFSDEMTGKRFRHNVLDLLGDNLAMNPIPQLVKPVLDVYANVDSFTGRPIETMGMEKLQADWRFSERTTMAARGASTAINAVTGLVGAEGPSPVQLDHLVRGYFGWLGAMVVSAGDVLARPATGQTDRPQPDYWRTLSGAMLSSLDDAPSRYVSAMYQQAKEVEQVYGTWRHMQAQGQVEEAQAFREENAEALVRYRQVEAVKKATSRLNAITRQIESGPGTPAEKRERIREVNEQKDAIARRLAPV